MTEQTTTQTTPLGKLKPGDMIHFRRSTLAFGYVRATGDSLILTADQITGSFDRTGRSWLDEVDDPDARIGRGPWPDGEPRWSYGDPMWEQAREQARKTAWSHEDPKIRAEALANVEQIYGPPVGTSKTLNSASDPSIRISEDQERQRRQAGVRHASAYTPGERIDP